jgi:predicted histone-like DNA-binding protein
MITYKIVAQANQISSEESEPKYYPRICNRKKMNLQQLARRISQQSSASEVDVQMVLWAFISNIPDLLLDNYSIELDNFGIFSLHARAEGALTEKEVKAKNITDLRIAFKPNKVLKEELRGARFKKKK